MKLSSRIDKEHKDKIEKVYHRKDSSFNMAVVKNMIKEIEDGEYDSEKYSVRDIEFISEYLYDQWLKYLDQWVKILEERKEKGWWCWPPSLT